MSLLPQYVHIVNPRLKHTYLTFDDRGNLVIKSPKVSQHYIEQLLLKKSSWINSAREKHLQKKGKVLDFSRPEVIFYQGQAYSLKLEKQIKKRIKFTFEHNVFLLRYHHYDKILFQKHINNFYKEKAEQYIPPLVEKWSKQMSLFPNNIRFRKTKRQWGSCSGKNIVSFNTAIMKLPQDVAEYIIVHELAHIKYKNHQKDFWNLVKYYLPNYKECIVKLHTYTT